MRVAAIPRRALLHVARLIGNSACAPVDWRGGQRNGSRSLDANPCFDMCVIYDCRLSLKLQGDRVLPLSELCHLCVWLMIMQLLKESTTPWIPVAVQGVLVIF